MPAGRSGPRPTPIYCPYPATRPQYSIEKLSPVYATRNIKRVDGKSQKAFKSLCAGVQRDEEKRKRKRKRKKKREKVRMSLTLLRIPHDALADRDPCCQQAILRRKPPYAAPPRALGSHNSHNSDKSSWN